MKHNSTILAALGLMGSTVALAQSHATVVENPVPRTNNLVVAKAITPEPASQKLMKAAAADDAEKVEVFVDLNYDPEHYEFKEMYFSTSDIYYQFTDYNMDEIKVLPGTYDILVKFSELDRLNGTDEMGSIPHWVIREQVEVTEGSYFAFDPEEATTHIKFECYYPDGEKFKQTRYFFDEEWNETVEKGNFDGMYYVNHVIIDGQPHSFSSLSNLAEVYFYPGKEFGTTYAMDAEFLINEVSDRFTFATNRLAYNDHDQTWYAIYLEAKWQDKEEIIVSNDPSSYVFHEENWGQTPEGKASINGENPRSRMSIGGFTKMSQGTSGWSLYFTHELEEGETIKAYQSVPDFETLNFYPTYQLGLAEGGKYDTFWERMTYDGHDTFAPNTIAKDGKPYSFGTINEFYRMYPKNGWFAYKSLFPLNPVYSGYINPESQAIGSSCPIILARQEFIDDTYYLYFSDYIGRRGESFQSMLYTIKSDVYYDGELVQEKEGTNAIGWTVGSIDGHDFKVVISSNNVLVDGLAGKSQFTIDYNSSAEVRNTLPIVSMLDFVNTNGAVTDRFSTAAEGTLRFYAADYQNTGSGLGVEYAALPLTGVTVMYAPYGEENWQELEINEIPENFYELNAGYFYTAALQGVKGVSETGWYDLKVIIAGENGNKSEQLISPAFRLDDFNSTGVSAIEGNEAKMLNSYSIDGKRTNALQQGFNIVKMSDGSVEKTFVK